MILSDQIAALIDRMLEEGGGRTEVKRNDLAQQLGCVPSQISYVITSRFTPERGYVIDSRRGGGGCIRREGPHRRPAGWRSARPAGTTPSRTPSTF